MAARPSSSATCAWVIPSTRTISQPSRRPERRSSCTAPMRSARRRRGMSAIRRSLGRGTNQGSISTGTAWTGKPGRAGPSEEGDDRVGHPEGARRLRPAGVVAGDVAGELGVHEDEVHPLAQHHGRHVRVEAGPLPSAGLRHDEDVARRERQLAPGVDGRGARPVRVREARGAVPHPRVVAERHEVLDVAVDDLGAAAGRREVRRHDTDHASTVPTPPRPGMNVGCPRLLASSCSPGPCRSTTCRTRGAATSPGSSRGSARTPG